MPLCRARANEAISLQTTTLQPAKLSPMSTTLLDFAAINAAFQALSPGEKRRAIAQDVLGYTR